MNAFSALLAATLTVGGTGDVLGVDARFPPALEAHPTNSDRAFVAASSNGPGVFEFRISPSLSLDYVGAVHQLSANQNCTESAPFNTPLLAGFSLEHGTGETRGWITTTSCELAVPFSYASGAGWTVLYSGLSRTSVPTKHTITGAFTRYQSDGGGAATSSFKTNYTGSALRIGNRLVVSTSNIQQSGSNPIFNPGTVLFFALDDSGPTTTVTPASPFFAVTSDPNPVALTELPGGRVAVTNAGIYDASFPPQVTGSGSIDILDVATGLLVGSIPLGTGNPSGRGLALDPTSSVAVAGSATFRRLVAVDVRGVAALPTAPVDARLQRPSCNGNSLPSAGGVPCLRERVIRGGANPIVLAPPPGSSGVYSYVPQVRFGASGDFLAATSFNDGGLALVAFDDRNLDLPHPLLPSRFGVPQTLAATGPAGEIGEECCPGPMILHANSAGGLAATDVLFATGSPNGLVVRGDLSGTISQPAGDFDGDGVQDALDDCPVEANAGQADSGGVGSSTADGIGDVCQCGDVSGDGRVDGADEDALRGYLAGTLPALPAPQKCDVSGGGACDLVDTVRLRRTLAGVASGGIAYLCAPFVP